MPLQSLRSTQRAPKGCTECTRRKIKCTKEVPCRACIKRGEELLCTRETVIVRGRVTTAPNRTEMQTYDQLLEENKQLRAELSRGRLPPLQEAAGASNSDDAINELEKLELQLFESLPYRAGPSFQPCDNVFLPSRQCSQEIVKYGAIWTSWVHYALDQPTFEREHKAFWDNIEYGMALEDHDPTWLAIYFGVITASISWIVVIHIIDSLRAPCFLWMITRPKKHVSHLVSSFEPPANYYVILRYALEDITAILRSWYSASLYYLNKSEYFRRYDIRAVQAIAILNMSFNYFGDYSLYHVMWASAIRIAQKLGMDSKEGPVQTVLTNEQSRRLWWTLIICEWLSPNVRLGLYRPCIADSDFNTPLPSPPSNALPAEGQIPDPIFYHIALAEISTFYCWFRGALRAGKRDVAELVRVADSRLAEMINWLPPHLNPDEQKTLDTEARDAAYPWAPWQKFDLVLTLLSTRLSVNCTLQTKWSSSKELSGQRSVSLECARTITWISSEWQYPVRQRKQWHHSSHLYTAGVTLAIEAQRIEGPLHALWVSDVKHCIELLSEVKSPIAHRSAELLIELLSGT